MSCIIAFVYSTYLFSWLFPFSTLQEWCLSLVFFWAFQSFSCSTWTRTFLPWWPRAQTITRSEASSASSWSTAWPVASSTRPSRERPKGRCTSSTPRTGWWWVPLHQQHTGGVTAVSILLWLVKRKRWLCSCDLTPGLCVSDFAVWILEHQVPQERVLCDRAVRGHGALQQHCVQLAGSTTCPSGAPAVLHFPLLHFYTGGHANREGHHQPPSAQ